MGPRPAEMRYHYFLGVKWSQVQILSARPELAQVRALSVWGIGLKTDTPQGYVAQQSYHLCCRSFVTTSQCRQATEYGTHRFARCTRSAAVRRMYGVLAHA